MIKHLLLSIILLLTLQCRSQCTSLFYDSFESGSYTPTWTLGTGFTSANVTSGGAFNGSFKFEGIGGNSQHFNGLSTAFAPVTPNYLAWAIYPTGGAATNYFAAGDNLIATSNCMVLCYWFAGSGIRFLNSAIYDYTASPSQWYFIELKNINYTTHKFDIYINNVLWQSGFAFKSAAVNNLSRIHLYNYSPSTATWDNIKMGNLFSASAVTQSISCFGGSNGSSTISVAGAPGPFTYSWTSPAVSTTSVAAGLSLGNYTCTVSNGTCLATASLLINQPAQLLVSSTQTNVSCFSGCNAVGNAIVSGGTLPYSYNWAPAGGSANIAYNLCMGNYTCFVTDANACTASQTYTISQPPQMTATISQTNINCVTPTGSAYVNVTGGAGPFYTYSWTPSAGSSAFASPLVPITYTCIIKDANVCALVVTVNVTSNTTPPPLSVSGGSLICIGQTSTLTANGASTYTWNTGDNTISITVSPTVNSTYSVTGIDNTNGCIATVTVTQNVSLCTEVIERNDGPSRTMSVYPNPNNGKFSILFEGNLKYNLINSMGRSVAEFETDGTFNNSLEFLNLVPGIYYLVSNQIKIKIIVNN